MHFLARVLQGFDEEMKAGTHMLFAVCHILSVEQVQKAVNVQISFNVAKKLEDHIQHLHEDTLCWWAGQL